MSTQPNRRGNPFSRKLNSAKSRAAIEPRSDKALGRIHYGLTLEQLESRLVLSGSPVLTAPTMAVTYLEGDTTPSINFQFTDTLAAGGGSVASSPGLLRGRASQWSIHSHPERVPQHRHVQIDGPRRCHHGQRKRRRAGRLHTPVQVHRRAAWLLGLRHRCVRSTNVNIPLGVTIKAIGSRPLALASTTAITVLGTIDVSAYHDPNTIAGDTPAAQQRLAGAGGGNGGFDVFDHGSPAAGAPASITTGKNPFPQFDFPAPFRGAGGGGFGGLGGPGFRGDLTPTVRVNLGGVAYGDLAIGIQGGSGGGAAWEGFSFPLDGGGGGGGIELDAVGSITVSGAIRANGGNGVSFAGGAGAGGGAGGGILLHAPSVTVSGTLAPSAATRGEMICHWASVAAEPADASPSRDCRHRRS